MRNWLLALLLLATPAWAGTYYVDQAHPSASDSNVGSETQPWRTITRGACAIRPGDTLLVKGESETAPTLYPERVGFGAYTGPDCNTLPLWKTVAVQGLPLTIQAVPRRSVLMYGFQNARLDGNQRGWVHWEGFQITTLPVAGVNIEGIWNTGPGGQAVDNAFFDVKGRALYFEKTPSDAWIERNEITRATAGIHVGGSNWVVQDNTITDLRQWGTGLDSDYARAWGTGGLFRRNAMYGTSLANIGGAHVDCVQSYNIAPTDPGLWNSVFEENVCGDAHQGFFFSFTYPVANLTVRNNLIARITSWGVYCGNAGNCQVQGNTFAHHGIYGVGCRANATCSVTDNLFYNVPTEYMTDSGGVYTSAGHNLLYEVGQTITGYADPGNILNQDPRFVNPGTATPMVGAPWDGDFRLQFGSPAHVGATVCP